MDDDSRSTVTHLKWREMEEQQPRPHVQATASRKVLAGVCGILLGALGVHKFVLGYGRQGLIMLLVTVVTLGYGGIAMALVGLIEGIIYLTKSDEEFIRIYVSTRRVWF